MSSCRPERLCLLTKDYFRGAHRLGAASHFHYRTPTPTPPRHPHQGMSNSGAENGNSPYLLYSMSRGHHMTSKSCHSMESCETTKTVYPNTMSVWDEPFRFNESQVLLEVNYSVSPKLLKQSAKDRRQYISLRVQKATFRHFLFHFHKIQHCLSHP